SYQYGLDNDKHWRCFAEHCKATTFADLPSDYLAAKWRFHPAEFITVMRRCGWLNETEFTQLLPQNAIRKSRGVVLWEFISSAATSRTIKYHRIPLNRALRKWCIDTPLRQATFFGNSVQETQWWSLLAEASGSSLWYAPWYGRGFLQLTNPDNYVAYWRYRARTIPEALHAQMVNAYEQIASMAPASRENSGLQDINFPALTSEMKAWRAHIEGIPREGNKEAKFAPSDSAGYYWAKNNMSKEADRTHVLERVTIQTNKGNKIYYRSQGFWRASATVNLPTAVKRTNYTGINGFDARCVAYGYALAVLTEMRFANSSGQIDLFFPDSHSPRRDAK
ncbi:MAG: hypothetical protein J7605_19470, partial [Variovorax sp.]|nr:hypothetical protein [Variovorax sp.]